jgi:hypothetical protein
MQDYIYDDQYTGPRHTYGFVLRPLDINTHPKLGCILGSYKADDKRARYGSVDYARRLTDEEVKKWELVYLEVG